MGGVSIASGGHPRQTRAVTDRVLGALLFLPVPLVLWLFTRAPFGVVTSLALGALIMVTHRFYARPFALARAGRRCLWCGASAAGAAMEVIEPSGRTMWRACRDAHRARALATLATARRHRLALRLGILGGLGVFLPMAVAASRGLALPLRFADSVALFKLAVGATVLPFGWLATRGAPSVEPPAVPFPVHIQALVGTVAVLWLFRVVGAVWLVQAVVHVVSRLT